MNSNSFQLCQTPLPSPTTTHLIGRPDDMVIPLMNSNSFQLCQTPLLHIVSLVFLVVFRIICFLYFSQFLCLFVLCLYTFPASEIRFLKFAALRFLCQEFIVSPVCISCRSESSNKSL